jgi:glycosyltransferase involved in cell wall biosynthesis
MSANAGNDHWMKRKFVIVDQNAVSAEGHFQTYTNALALAAHEAGDDVTVLWNKRFPIESCSAPYAMGLHFSYTEGEAAARNLLQYGEGHFGFELERALAPLRLGAHDLVLVHTCHFVELVEALDYLVMLPPDRNLPTFHIVLRYDPGVFQCRMSRVIRHIDALSRSRVMRDKLRFHSDTERLAAEFSRLFGTPVGICPIPVDLTRILSALADAKNEKSLSRPLVASYLGTARSEKGYTDLLDAIAFLTENYVATDRLHFTLQCSERSLRSEPGLLEYQEKLEAYLNERGLEDKVRLVKEVVDPEKYCELIAKTDIMILPYSAVSYRCRSSSVLIEALAAGKVVVTTHGSWMGSRVDVGNAVCYASPHELGPALAQAVDRFDALSAGAKARQAEAIASGDPAALAKYFVRNCVADAEPWTSPVVLTILDGAAIANGRAGATLHRLQYFDAAGYRVMALLLTSGDAEGSATRSRLADALRPFALERVFIMSADQAVGEHRDELASILSNCAPECVYLSCGLDRRIVDALGLRESPTVFEAGVDGRGAAETNEAILLFATARQAEEARTRGVSHSNSHYAFPCASQAPRLDDLAGPVNGFELVASADPYRPEFGIDMKPVLAQSSRYRRLKALDSVDILIVSSAIENLRWFLERIYEPFLSQRQTSVIVVGDIDENALPHFDDLFFIGPVGDRDPLYAAAKVVVVPDSSYDGTSYELLEALAKRMPVVTTRSLAAAIVDEDAGLDAHDEEGAFADAIERLLGSADLRMRASAASASLAERLGAGAASVGAMNALFHSLIGDRALNVSPLGRTSEPADRLVEWAPAVRGANAFIRSYIGGEALAGVDELRRLEDRGSSLVTRLADCLIARRQAPLLKVDGWLLARIMLVHAEGIVSELARIAEVTQKAAGLSAAPSDGSSNILILDRRFHGKIVTSSMTAGRVEPKCATGGVEIHPRVDNGDETIAWTVEAKKDDDAPELCTIDLGDVRACVVYQHIPISLEARILGRRLSVRSQFSRGQGLSVSRPAMNWPQFATRMLSSVRDLFGGRRSPLYKWLPWANANPLFDAEWYLAEYPNVAASGLKPFRHYDRYGFRKGYNPNPFFDTNWYLDSAPELRDTGANPLDHYLHFGANGAFDPGPNFSGRRYLDANPDVRSWRLNPLLHYVEWGRREGREIYPSEPLRSRGSLALPAIVGSRGASWVELELKDEFEGDSLPIELYCGDRKLDVTIHTGAGRARLRAFLPRLEVVSGLIELQVTQSAGDCVEISALWTGWSSSDNERALAEVAVAKC